MNYTILLDRTDNIEKFEAQEQSRFIYTVLQSMSVPIEWDNPDAPLTIEQKQKFRRICEEYSIRIIDNPTDGIIQVFSSNELIAQWNKCRYITKLDKNQKDHKKQLYLEAHIDFWAKFEEEQNIEEHT
jgi:hypothetical protein